MEILCTIDIFLLHDCLLVMEPIEHVQLVQHLDTTKIRRIEYFETQKKQSLFARTDVYFSIFVSAR